MNLKNYAPVVVFAYNRADKLENCLKNLEKCPEATDTDLFIYCDGEKNEKDRDGVKRVKDFVNNYALKNPFKKVVTHIQEKNRGLALSVMTGVTEVVNEYGKVIVVEDDLVVERSFLEFLNDGLGFFAEDKKIGTISAYTHPMRCLNNFDKDIFATRKAECWGWATWSDRWNNAAWAETDFSGYLKDRKLRLRFESLEAGLDRLMYLQYKGKIDSWAVRWVYYLFCNGQLTVYPSVSRVVNDGFDGSGIHCDDKNIKRSKINPVERNNLDCFGRTCWEKCDLDIAMERAYGKYSRRMFIMYIFETVRYMCKTK